MADQEIIKHTKKVYGIWSSKEHSIWHKIREFLIEIFIIVFAVSLSIWFHDRSEHKHQQKEVKQFLTGLKDDLDKDIQEMEEDKKAFIRSRQAFLYITHIKEGEPLNKDSVRKHYQWITNTTGFMPNDGRFEGFKSSGKIGTIENPTLQDDIMDLYQENIPSLILSTNIYTGTKQKLGDYLTKNLKRQSDSTSNALHVLLTNEAQNLCSSLTGIDEILFRYDACIDKIRAIVHQIDEEYTEK